MLEKIKEFKPSSWAIENKLTVYLITIFITIAGIMAYNSLPKENFPDITVPTIYISTINGGNSPTNIENTITKPIEKRLKSISGIKKFNSTSLQDVSVIIVEFRTDVKTDLAKQKVKDAVDEARADMPQVLTREPVIKEIAFSEIPIMYINISGNYDLKQLKKYAENLQEGLEGLKEINEASGIWYHGSIADIDQNNLDPLETGEHLWNLTYELEDLLKRNVDLLTERSLKNPYFIQRLNETKFPIYGFGS